VRWNRKDTCIHRIRGGLSSFEDKIYVIGQSERIYAVSDRWCYSSGSLHMNILLSLRDFSLNFQRSILLIQIQDNELATV